MTRNYVILYLITSAIVLTALFETVFGYQGVLINQQLESQAIKEQQILQLEELNLKQLEEKYRDINSPQHLLDAAKSLGYVSQGETIYYFKDDEGNLISQEKPDDAVFELLIKEKESTFKAFSLKINALFGISLTFIIFLFLVLLKRKEQNKVLKFKNYDNFNNGY
jgi:cell division protein FtsB